ncbi:hypothetical protein HDV00_003261 [Rhizophlyctis rosea]|nr:hypothetical protein HDV00_003261 [Rhizophlyctis rosea]
MTTTSFAQLLFACLPPSTTISEDVKEYLTGALEGADTVADAREVASDFLQDAGLDNAQLEELFNRVEAVSLGETTPATSAHEEEEGPRRLTDDVQAVSLVQSKELSSKKAERAKSPASRPSSRRTKAKQAAEKPREPEDINEPVITAITQTSRFHTETIETLSNDVDLKGVQLAVNERDLLIDAELRLFAGTHYGLVGRNGVGKSTLLRAIGHGMLIGFPTNIRVLYVEQLEDVDPNLTVVDTVLGADRNKVKTEEEVAVLENSLATGDELKVARAVREIQLVRLLAARERAHQIAVKRSGARGSEARKRLLAAEKDLADFQEKCTSEPTKDELSQSIITANDMLQELHTYLDQTSAPTAASKALKILAGLGFPAEWRTGPLAQLSGGWRIRVALAQALFIEPDVLLIDEPTNHLDLPAILWLQAYLQSLSSTVVVVSHDRRFLNAVVSEIIVLRKQKLEYHVGNYDEYVTHVEDDRKHMERMKENEDRKRTHIEKSIQEGIRKAKKSGDDKKLGMVASRQKKLERLGIEKNERGHRFRLNDQAGYFETSRKQIVLERPDPPPKFDIPHPDPLRHHGSLIQVDNVSFLYPSTNPRKPSSPVIQNVTLNVGQTTRIGIVGANGAGKSTLINLLAQQLSPTKGTVEVHPSTKLGYFAQRQTDALHTDPELRSMTVLRYVMGATEGDEKDVWESLGRFGMGGFAQQTVGSLSGGQMVRVGMCVAVWKRPNVLILDEPTNHLDMETIEALIASLKSFPGAVVVVSHDQYFIDCVADKVFWVGKGKVEELEGGVKQYVKRILPKEIEL